MSAPNGTAPSNTANAGTTANGGGAAANGTAQVTVEILPPNVSVTQMQPDPMEEDDKTKFYQRYIKDARL